MSESINSFTDSRGVEMVAKPSGPSCDGCDYYALGDDKLCREAPICGGPTRGGHNIVWQPKESK